MSKPTPDTIAEREKTSPFTNPNPAYTFAEYQTNAVRTLNRDLGSFNMHLVDCALGITGESGEVAEAVKHYLARTHEMCAENGEQEFRNKIKRELGDILWYIASTCELMGWDLSEVALANNHKLYLRHGDAFSGHGLR